MRRFVTGVKDGKSCMVRVTEVSLDRSEISGHDFIDFSVNPPAPRPAGDGAFLDVQLPVGGVKWVTSHFPPGSAWPTMHHTDTIDCHTIISGSIDLILDDGPHTLSAGDCVIVTGVDHAWQAGDEGCISSLLLIGTPSPEAIAE
jgi:mannose-6-phosphate isomerase-like protein (cupin superfamily)